MDKNKLFLAGCAAAGLLLTVSGYWFADRDRPDEAYTDVGFYTEYLETRIRELCTHVAGVTEAEVFLTMDCSAETVYGQAGDVLLLSENGRDTVRLCEIYPKVRGVAVVCTGGGLPHIQEMLTDLLAAALDLPRNKIQIAGS